MKVLVWNGPRHMTVEERKRPEPGRNEVLLRVGAVGICGSEIEGYLGNNSLRVPPLIMGHEFSGEVVAVGPHEGDAQVPAVGQRVTANPLISCGQCVYCRAGKAHICSHRRLIGAHQPGAFAEYVVVPSSALISLPEQLDIKTAALAEPFSVAIHAVNLGQVGEGTGVVVWGAGSIGLLVMCAARVERASRIIAVDTNPQRMQAARLVGAQEVLDAREGNVAERVRELMADMPNVVVFDAVGRSVTRQAAVTAAGSGATVVLVGLHDSETTFEVNNMIRSEVTLIGSYAYTMQEFRRAVELLAMGEVPTEAWMDVRGLDAGPDSFVELVDSPGAATKIMLIP